MKKIFLIVAMIFVTIMANAHVFLFQLKHEKFGNTNLIIDTDKQTIYWKDDGLFDIKTIKYSNICIDNPYVNNSSMSGYEKVANMQYFIYSSNLPKPKSIKASIDDIAKGKYGEGCIITINGVILIFKNESKYLFVDLDRRDVKEYVETFTDFWIKISGIKPSSKSPGTSSSTRPTGNCPDGNHPHLIDLGLPSGTKWACCNVGASKPEDYGGYFAWGISTINRKSASGNVGKNISGTQYDAATANWGSSWVMPSLEQMKELMDKCSRVWTTKNGVNCMKFTGSNGASIFLPAAGSRRNGELYYVGSIGNYWSSTPNDEGYAYGLGFITSSADLYSGTDRDSELSVRPVRKN